MLPHDRGGNLGLDKFYYEAIFHIPIFKISDKILYIFLKTILLTAQYV